MLRRLILSLSLVGVCIFNTYSQDNIIDSLLKEIDNTEIDSVKSKFHLSVAYKYVKKDKQKSLNHGRKSLYYANRCNSYTRTIEALDFMAYAHRLNSSFDSATHYYETFIKVADTSRYSETLIFFYNGYGVHQQKKGNYLISINMHERAYKVSKELRDSTKMVESLRLQAVSYYLLGNLDKALKNYIEALELAEQLKTYRRTYMLYTNIAGIYSDLKEYEESLQYLKKALKMIESDEDIPPQPLVFLNIANSYVNLERYKEAETPFFEALQLTLKDDTHRFTALVYIGLSNYYTILKDYPKAKEYALQSYRYSQYIADKYIQAKSSEELGKVYFELKKYNKAIKYFKEGLKISEDSDYQLGIQQISERLSQAYAETGDYKNAYYAHKLFKQAADTVFNREKVKELTRAEMQYEFNKQKNVAEQLAKEKELHHQIEVKKLRYFRNLFGIAGVFIAVTLGLTFYIYRLKQVKKTHELSKALIINKQQSMSRQMNPHFIFNTLNSIQKYILTNNIDASMNYISEFAMLMRTMLNNSQFSTISIKDEIDALKIYANLETKRFKGNLKFDVMVDEKIDIDKNRIPTYVLQPILENAIKHGLQPLGGKGNVNLKFKKTKEGIEAQMDNDGVPFPGEEEKSEKSNKHKSMATSLINRRLNIMSHYYKKDFYIRYERRNDAGTSVIVNLPEIKPGE